MPSPKRKESRRLKMMAQGNGKGIGGIEMLWRQLYVQQFLNHSFHLLLRGGTIATDSNLSLPWSIFENRDSGFLRGNDSRPLCSTEFEHHLGILAHKRRLYSQGIWLMNGDEFLHAAIDIREPVEWIFNLSQVKNAHSHIVRA